jgi:hypothetical protein
VASDARVPTRDEPGVARDASSMTDILRTLSREGFVGDFTAAGPGREGVIRCSECGSTSDASLFVLEQLRRLEGASDPDEMVVIAALRCPVCDLGGAMVLTYGPAVTEADAAVLDRLPPALAPKPTDPGR